MSTIGLKQVVAVIPLRKPREKLWTKRNFERGKASQIKSVLAKFKEVEYHKSESSSRHQKRVERKKDTDNRPNISCLKGGFARESPGT